MNMPKITVVAKVVAKQNSLEIVKAELLRLITPTRNEEGCIEYRLHQDNEDPALFVFYETWESEACLARHMESDHFKHYVGAIDGMLKEKTVRRMTMIG